MDSTSAANMRCLKACSRRPPLQPAKLLPCTPATPTYHQIDVLKRTSLLVYPHGATMTHAMFLPRGAVALEVIQWPNVTEPHGWLQVHPMRAHGGRCWVAVVGGMSFSGPMRLSRMAGCRRVHCAVVGALSRQQRPIMVGSTACPMLH